MRTATLILTLFAFLAAGLRAAPPAANSTASKNKKPVAKAAAKPAAKTVAKRPARGAVKTVAAKKSTATPAARRITAKRIAPKRKATASKTAAKRIAPKPVTPAKRIAPAKSTTARKITAKKVTPKRIAPKRRTTARRTSRTKTTPVKFTPGERTLAPIACATRQTAPDEAALCTDCPDHALSEAYALLGLKYRRGGTSQETGMDCSGFTQHVYRRSCNVDLPRSASQQFQVGVPTQKEDLLRGDLVFFKSRRGWHVGIYTGDGNFIHSPNRRSSVKISSLSASYYKKTYLGARRLTQNIIEPLSIDRPVLQSLPDVPALSDAEADAEADEAADEAEAANEEAVNEAGEAGSGNAVRN